MIRWFCRFLIARAIRRQIVAYRIGRASGRCDAPAESAALGMSGVDPFGFVRIMTDAWSDVEQPKRSAPKAAPGRQRIPMPCDSMSIFGGSSWDGPLHKTARSANWEDCHTFPGEKPWRDRFGLHGDQPISFICVACELEQPPVTTSRTCPYCGTKYRVLGSRLFWWREAVKPELEWKP